MLKTPNLIWLRSFEAAARHLSFTSAANELGLTQTAVSLHIRSLEASLDRKLFTRAARRLTLTETGQAYSLILRRTLGDIALSTSSLFGVATSQVLSLRAPVSTASLWLTHRLPKFSAAHPEISIRLVSNIWAEPTEQEDVDVEIRLGNGGWPSISSRKVSKEAIVPVASASLHQGTISAEKLRLGPLVQILGFEDMLTRYLNAHNLPPVEETTPYAVDTTVAALDIVAAGGGHTVVLERFAQTAINTGKPINIVGKPISIDQSHYLMGISARDGNESAKQLFEEWLISEFAEPNTDAIMQPEI